MAEVLLKNIWKNFNGTPAVKGVSIEIPDKDFFIPGNFGEIPVNSVGKKNSAGLEADQRGV